MKRVLMWAVVVLLVIFVVTRPAAAASVTKALGTILVTAAMGFSDFLTGLVS